MRHGGTWRVMCQCGALEWENKKREKNGGVGGPRWENLGPLPVRESPLLFFLSKKKKSIFYLFFLPKLRVANSPSGGVQSIQINARLLGFFNPGIFHLSKFLRKNDERRIRWLRWHFFFLCFSSHSWNRFIIIYLFSNNYYCIFFFSFPLFMFYFFFI